MGMKMWKVRIIQLVVAILIAYITFLITGSNYDMVSWFGGAICLGTIMIIREASE